MAAVRRLVLDVLKPHSPSLAEFAAQVTEVKSVAGATASLVERDKEVETVKVTLEGSDLDQDRVEAAIEEQGATVHSVDEVACGEYVVEDRPTRQDG